MLGPCRLAALLVSVPAALAASPYPNLPEFFVRGDPNADGLIDVSDPVAVLGHLFLGAGRPPCLDAADANDDGAVDISDPAFLLRHLFLGGAPPGDPHTACGPDPSPGSLGCASYPPCEFESLISVYSNLTTIAGKGERQDDVNEWEVRFEGGLAVEAELSNPHFAMGDDAGNIYIADKEAHAIRKVTPEGRIFTVAGTGLAGDDGDAPGPATALRLFNPNGLWVRADGTFYILDTDNGKIRRVDLEGIMTTLVDTGIIDLGRGLWVRDDERLLYFASGTEVKRWTPQGGVEVHASGFEGLGNIAMDPAGNLVVTDRDAHTVERIEPDGGRTRLAGNGTAVGGGDGQPALATGLEEVRAVWFLPQGGFFLGTHRGSQVWYVDTRGIAHLFLNGRRGAHGGDGEHFLSPGLKVSEVRSVTLDAAGNLIVTENDAGFVRKVEHRPPAP